jgi:thioredoxin-related protein
MKKIFLSLCLFVSVSFSESFFLLTKIPKAYLVVENYSKVLPINTKEEVLEEMRTITDELKIDTTGYSHRTLVFLMEDKIVAGTNTLNVILALGEEVKRLDDREDVYAITYDKRKSFIVDGKSKEEIYEEMLEKVDLLLSEFSEQYLEDNNDAKGYKDFAKDMNYETDYNTALQKAKKEKKDIMFVVVANFCPWCQKLEKLVLSRDSVNAKIHEKYIPLIMNREIPEFPKKFDSPIIPTMYFVDYKDESVKAKVIGYNNRHDFLNIINE